MFSILTPTYNRADTLHRVYDSLRNQTLKDFEWIIIDDASSDNTDILVNKWKKEPCDFSISYHKLDKNQGKSNAVNLGLEFCTRDITLIADSDDTFVSETLSELKTIWTTIFMTENDRRIAAIWTLVKDESYKLIGSPYPSNFWQVDLDKRVLNRKKPIAGEKWHSWRTNILKEYKMYVNENSFVSEGATWNRINRDYDFLCVNLVHRIYWHSPEGLIHKKKSRLKIAKIHYYSSYFQLYDIRASKIISKKYYRNMAFTHFKALIYYRDKKKSLGWLKILVSAIAFCLVLPQNILFRVRQFN